jgi:hypothetical protein
MHTASIRSGARSYQPTTPRATSSRWTVVTIVLAPLAAAVIALWGLLGLGLSRSSGTVAQPGELVAVPGGLLRVDRVIPEHMAAMDAGGFARAGMNMSGMGIDMAPQGYRRFTVELTLVGQVNGGLHYSADQFRLTGRGMEETGTYRHQPGAAVVPRGTATSVSLTFQVPDGASELSLHFRDGERPIALDLGPAGEQGGHAHDHGQPAGSPGR